MEVRIKGSSEFVYACLNEVFSEMDGVVYISEISRPFTSPGGTVGVIKRTKKGIIIATDFK